MNSDLHPTTQAVWQAVTELFDELGYAPSFRQIARRCFISGSNVRRHLDHLERHEILLQTMGEPRAIRLLHRHPGVPQRKA